MCIKTFVDIDKEAKQSQSLADNMQSSAVQYINHLLIHELSELEAEQDQLTTRTEALSKRIESLRSKISSK